MAELQLPKLTVRVRFPSLAPKRNHRILTNTVVLVWRMRMG